MCIGNIFISNHNNVNNCHKIAKFENRNKYQNKYEYQYQNKYQTKDNNNENNCNNGNNNNTNNDIFNFELLVSNFDYDNFDDLNDLNNDSYGMFDEIETFDIDLNFEF